MQVTPQDTTQSCSVVFEHVGGNVGSHHAQPQVPLLAVDLGVDDTPAPYPVRRWHVIHFLCANDAEQVTQQCGRLPATRFPLIPPSDCMTADAGEWCGLEVHAARACGQPDLQYDRGWLPYIPVPGILPPRRRTEHNIGEGNILQRRYGGTTLGRQELDAEILDDTDGALWNRMMLDRCRVPFAPESQTSVVVAIDPSGGSGSNNGETGIIVACRGQDGHAYVLADASGRLSPERWATRAVDLYHSYSADRIVAEQNFGGAMVENTIRMVAHARVKMVQASRGKAIRAEPVVALYEQCRVHHVGVFAELEDQLCQWTLDGGGPSPDRLDALVWAITELMVDGPNTSVWAKL